MSASPWPRRVKQAVAGVVFGAGAVVLSGWQFQSATLKSVLPGLPNMSPLTALLFILASVGLFFSDGPAGPRPPIRALGRYRTLFVQACGVLLAFVGVLRLMAYALGWQFRWELLGYTDTSTMPTHLAPATALTFVLIGGAVCLMSTSVDQRIFQMVVLAAGFVGWLGLSRYIFGGQPLLPYLTMAVHTAVSFLALSIGLLCARPDKGLVALLTSKTEGGKIARRLVPATLLLPIAVGWLRLQGQRYGWYGTEGGVSLFSLANIVIFGGLIWANAALLHRSDFLRRMAEQDVLGQLERLSLLDRITRTVSQQLDLVKTYRVALSSLDESLPFDFGCICDYDGARQLLTVACVRVSSQIQRREALPSAQQQLPADTKCLGRCLAGSVTYEPDVAQLTSPFAQMLAGAGLQSVVAAPLSVDSGVSGIFLLARLAPKGFLGSECEFLRQFSEHVALAAHQSQLHASLRRAYDDLRQTQQAVTQQERLRALGQMASGVAHDINNALSPVMMCTESLLENEPSISPKGRKHLQTVQRAVDDIAQTVARLREFYRQREGPVALSPVNVNALVEQVLELTRARWETMAQRDGVVITSKVCLAKDLPAVMGIESEIRDSLVNLIFNAVDAMPRGGTLSVRTSGNGLGGDASAAASGSVQIEVSDSGVGMDEETRARCAEPFFTTKGERGTGLGLAMVYGTMRRHGGDLEIESSVGHGTTICLSFAAKAGVAKESSAPDSAPATIAAPLRILVVDDDPLIAKSLQETLQLDGHSVFAASGGAAGIEAFRTAREIDRPFQMVLTDLGMPEVDGRKVAAAIKAESPSTPVILLTGWGQRLVVEGDVPPDVDLVLNKPPKLRELRAALVTASAVVLAPEVSRT